MMPTACVTRGNLRRREIALTDAGRSRDDGAVRIQSRDQLRDIAHETVAIAERGSYRVDDQTIEIGAAVGRSVAGTLLYQPDETVATPVSLVESPNVEVTAESSLAASRRLGEGVACLVFASARRPGGGFLNGVQTQEEDIARNSALYACLRTVPDFYAHHRSHPELIYSDRIIYSPAVPVFRDDEGSLLPRPVSVSFLTAAAPNLAAVEQSQPEHIADIPRILDRRIRRVLAVAAAHGHRKLVLGAWGCGVFGNDPATVARAFAAALNDSPWFSNITFAILDRRPHRPIHTTFDNILRG